MDIIETNFESQQDRADRENRIMIEQCKLYLELIQASYMQDVPVGAKVTDIQRTLVFLLENIIKS